MTGSRARVASSSGRATLADDENSASAVARHIRRLVINGQLSPDQRLPQDEIAAAVGVSRIPVREAIIALQREGWLRVEPHRGAFVNALDARAVADHYELYGRYFGFAARRAIERSENDALGALEGLATKLASVKTPAAVERANRAFFDALINHANSHRLRVALRSMVPVVPDNFFATVPQAIEIQKRGVAALCEAIHRRDVNAAEAACLAMEREQSTMVIALLKSRSVVGNSEIAVLRGSSCMPSPDVQLCSR